MNEHIRWRARRVAQLAVVLGQVVHSLLRNELRLRSSESLVSLLRSSGIEFTGFVPPTMERRPLPRDARDVLWATDLALRVWPVARRRQCLRRALVIGEQLRTFGPALHLTVIERVPFQAHAALTINGQRLDLGELESERVQGSGHAAL